MIPDIFKHIPKKNRKIVANLLRQGVPIINAWVLSVLLSSNDLHSDVTIQRDQS